MKPNVNKKLSIFFCAKNLTIFRPFLGYALFHRRRFSKLIPSILTLEESKCELASIHVSFEVLILYFIFYLAPKKQLVKTARVPALVNNRFDMPY